MKLKLTNRVKELLESHPAAERFELNPSEIGDGWIDHSAAVRLGKAHEVNLYELLRGTEVYIDRIQNPPAKTDSYLKLMARLRIEDEERQYQKLVNSDPKGGATEALNLKSITDEVNEQLTTVFNILVSIVAVAWAFWYWCSSWSIGSRTLASLFSGLLTGAAEVVVFTGYLRRVSEAKERQKKHKEKELRKVIKSVVFHRGKEVETQQAQANEADESIKATTSFSNEKSSIRSRATTS